MASNVTSNSSIASTASPAQIPLNPEPKRPLGSRAASLPIDIQTIRSMAARAPPGSMSLGRPLSEEEFKAMRAKAGVQHTTKIHRP